MRRPDNCYEQFVAHIGPVFSLDWHPEERFWLGSAGRDKLVKVRQLWLCKLTYELPYHLGLNAPK